MTERAVAQWYEFSGRQQPASRGIENTRGSFHTPSDVRRIAKSQGFPVAAVMGIRAIIGIAVSNAIPLVDDANRHSSESERTRRLPPSSPPARSRSVPIAMTVVAAVVGLIPTAMALDRGSEANEPLALAVVGGLMWPLISSLFLLRVILLFFAKRTVAQEQEHPPQGSLAGAHA
jgi:Cu/Ag efflux pump CusA